MSGQLFGAAEKSIDAKGRMSIPKTFRDQIDFSGDHELYIVMIDGILAVFTPQAFDIINSQIQSKSLLSRKARDLQRFWGLRVHPLTWDSTGRIKLTPQQKQYAGIHRDVVLVGSMNRLEIWSREKYNSGSWLNDDLFYELSEALNSLD